MTVKEYLQRYLDADRAINAKLEQIERLRALATKTTQVLQPDKILSGQAGDKMSGIVGKIIDMETEVDADIDRLQVVKREVEAAIDAVDNGRLRDLLRYRYICGWQFEKISLALCYSYIHVCRLHGEALNAVTIKDDME